MKWGEVLFWLWAFVTTACLLLLIELFTRPVTGVATSLLIVVTLGFALRWAICQLTRLLQ
jgi:hypothetical protein